MNQNDHTEMPLKAHKIYINRHKIISSNNKPTTYKTKANYTLQKCHYFPSNKIDNYHIDLGYVNIEKKCWPHKSYRITILMMKCLGHSGANIPTLIIPMVHLIRMF